MTKCQDLLHRDVEIALCPKWTFKIFIGYASTCKTGEFQKLLNYANKNK